MTAPCHFRPNRLNEVLPSRHEPRGRPHVLDHPHVPFPGEDAWDFHQASSWIQHATEHEPAHHKIERPITEGQRLRARPDEQGLRYAQASLGEGFCTGVEANDSRLCSIERQIPACAAAYLESKARGPADKPRTPAFEAEELHHRAYGVIKPGDLLDASHILFLLEHSSQVLNSYGSTASR